MAWLALLSCAGGGASAQTSVPIRWEVFEYPPYFILSGPDKGKGLYDVFVRELAAELPGFTHYVEPSSPSRAEALMKRGDPVCTVSRLRTPEREAYSVFSRQVHLYALPVQLVVLERSAPAVQAALQDGRVSLARLLQARTVRVGSVENRRYGSAIDDLLTAASREPDAPVIKWTTDALFADAPKLMSLGRFDATLAYPSEFAALQALQPQLRFQHFPLAEASGLVAGRVSCTHSAVGRAVVEAIDQLPMPRDSVARLQLAYEALLPVEDREAYRQMVRAERAKGK